MNPKNFETPKTREAVMDREEIERIMIGILQTLPEGEDPKEFLINRVALEMKSFGEEHAKGIHDALQKIQSTELSEVLVKEATDLASRYLSINFTREEFDKARREAMMRESNYARLSELLAYGVARNGDVHIHLGAAKTMKPKEILASVQDGLKQLAIKIQEDPELAKAEKITATSWIVAKAPKMMERLGFTVLGEISEKEKQDHFAEETRDVASSFMTKEDLIARYGS